MLKRSVKRFNPATCTQNGLGIVQSTTSNTASQGFRIFLRGCESQALFIAVRDYSKVWTVRWGNAYDESWYKKWSNVAFTVSRVDGIIMYFNGVEVAKDTVSLVDW